ncbi:lectin-like domain-containing protein [Ornithinimicrobium tianjinense]|uniref:PKD domain-containing protein n=1 Tax=Ornithinimicrobium tianjinense TaxID=1195761 RepID=A0A917F334_9MICO|nr:PKD domain-containing protein [Ornithinimicrobium tianjinense]GGF40129.1 hypothetical protein GCM10011366_04700 [Ornithinimicrobium tianjinense]
MKLQPSRAVATQGHVRPLLGSMGASALVVASLVALPAISAQAVDPVCSTTTYTTFDTPLPADVTLNGNAAIAGPVGAKVLRVTPSALSQAGSAFTTNKVSFANDGSFSTFFTFTFTAQQAGGADGLVFTVQNDANTAGGPGGGIGYLGITPSVGVEFDNWYNQGIDPFSSNHVGINLNGSVVSNPVTGSPVPLDNPSALHRAWIDYNGATDQLEVRLADSDTRPATALLTKMVDLPAILGGSGAPVTDAFVGFTSGTGAAAANHDVHSWTLNNCYQPIDTPPTVDAGGPYTGDEGSPVTIAGSVVDDGTATARWSYAVDSADTGASCAFTPATSATTSVTCTDDGTYTLTLTGDDGTAAVSDTATLTVANVAPVVASVVPTFTDACTVSATASFSDAGSKDTHTASLDWGDGSSGAATVSASTASGSHTYAAAGTYVLTATVWDDEGAHGTAGASVTTKNAGSAFGAPLSPEGSVFRLGSTVPLKLTITDCSGHVVTTLSPTVTLEKVDSHPDGTVNVTSVEEVPTNGKVMLWNGEHYHYTLSTKRSEFLGGAALTAGSYRVTVSDPTLFSPATIEFHLR